MRIKRTRNLLYIFSSVMVLGLALISFDAPRQGSSVSVSGQSTTETSSPSPTGAQNHTASQLSTPTSTPAPSATPTPSLAQLNAAITIQPATDDIGTGLTTVITNHLNTYYADETLQVKEISNITCYYKKGIAEADYFVYASYDILYEGSNVPIPTLDEYIVCIDADNVTVHTSSENKEINEALFLSRGSESVSELYIKELLRCYMNAKLAVDEALLSSMITDPSYLNLNNIRKRTEYIEEYKNLQYLIYKCPENILEFDYLIFLANDSKIVNISTLAPGMEEFMITLDEQNYPLVFFGITSEYTDLYRKGIRSTDEFLSFYENNVAIPLENAILSDPDLREFIGRITNATGSN